MEHDAYIWSGGKKGSVQKYAYKKHSVTAIALEGPWASFCNVYGIDRVMILDQQHGAIIRQVNQDDNWLGESIEGDALITNNTRTALAISTADCVPLLFVDAQFTTIAAIHAGWRGLCNEIIPKTIATLQERVAIDQWYAFIGAGARSCCFTVGDTVTESLLTSSRKSVTAGYYNKNYDDYIGSAVIKNSAGESLVDLITLAAGQLLAAGMMPHQLFPLPGNQLSGMSVAQMVRSFDQEMLMPARLASVACTICDTALCSYRRSGGSSERQWWMIALPG